MERAGDRAFWNDFVARWEDKWTSALADLLRLRTVSGSADPEDEATYRREITRGFARLAEWARDLGFTVRNYDDRVLVIEAEGAPARPVLGIPIHLDVVPPGESWTRDPFGGQVQDGAVWGRGAQDDKGPIVQMLFGLVGAAELARRAGGGFGHTVRLIIVSEEEIGRWEDIPFYFEREPPPDFAIVPDAAFPITVGEKGLVNLNVEFEWSPPLNDAFELLAGERSNVVPGRAGLRIGRALLEGAEKLSAWPGGSSQAPAPPRVHADEDGLRVEFSGVSAHGSLPHKGHNAATDALEQAARLPQLQGHPAGRALAWLAQAGADLRGKFLSIDCWHERLGQTTVNLGVLRADRHGLRATLNIRNPIGLSCPETVERVRREALRLGEASSGLTVNRVGYDDDGREPIYVDPEQFPQWIEPMRRAYAAVTGRKAELQTIGGTTFAKAFPRAVCFGPVDEHEEKELAHQADEHVTLAALRRNVEIYGRTIAAIAL